MRMKTRLIMIATGMLTLFGLSSCIEVDSTISVKKDGSGTITEELVLGEQMMMMMQMGGMQGGAGAGAKDPMTQMLDKTKALKRAKNMGEGVELVSVKKLEAKGKMGVVTIFKFSDINKLSYSGTGAMDLGSMPTPGGEKAEEDNEGDGTLFQLVDGTLTVLNLAPDDGDAGEVAKEEDAADEMDEQSMAMAASMMKDAHMSVKLKIETGIEETNATFVDGDTVTLVDINFGKLVAHPKKLKALKSGDFKMRKAAMTGIDGVKFETKEKVVIKMK